VGTGGIVDVSTEGLHITVRVPKGVVLDSAFRHPALADEDVTRVD